MPKKTEVEVIKRRQQRVIGVFIDGVGLDHATNRLKRKVDLAALVRGVTAGAEPLLARYYTIIPHQDDSRHRAFLDAVRRAGLEPVVKRLPPKNINRQVSVDLQMTADIMAFALGVSKLPAWTDSGEVDQSAAGGSNLSRGPRLALSARSIGTSQHMDKNENNQAAPGETKETESSTKASDAQVFKIVTVVCPSRELSYPISLIRELGVDTVTADFGRFSGDDILKSSAKWIDLSDSETIWKE